MRAQPLNVRSILPRKQRCTHEEFVFVENQIERLVSKQELDELIELTVLDIVQTSAGKRVAYGWSAGKDSMALQLCCEMAGVHDCMMGMSELEYPEFLRFVTDNMPDGLTVISSGHDLDWLAENPRMLFPDSEHARKWFKMVQHDAQDKYFRENNLDVLILGRRIADGNNVNGKSGGSDAYYTNARDITLFSPLVYWRHEDVIAAVHYYNLPVAPVYRWPRGYRVGTGSWPARQWCESVEHGWNEVYTIDPAVVVNAATRIESAATWLSRQQWGM